MKNIIKIDFTCRYKNHPDSACRIMARASDVLKMPISEKQIELIMEAHSIGVRHLLGKKNPDGTYQKNTDLSKAYKKLEILNKARVLIEEFQFKEIRSLVKMGVVGNEDDLDDEGGEYKDSGRFILPVGIYDKIKDRGDYILLRDIFIYLYRTYPKYSFDLSFFHKCMSRDREGANLVEMLKTLLNYADKLHGINLNERDVSYILEGIVEQNDVAGLVEKCSRITDELHEMSVFSQYIYQTLIKTLSFKEPQKRIAQLLDEGFSLLFAQILNDLEAINAGGSRIWPVTNKLLEKADIREVALASIQFISKASGIGAGPAYISARLAKDLECSNPSAVINARADNLPENAYKLFMSELKRDRFNEIYVDFIGSKLIQKNNYDEISGSLLELKCKLKKTGLNNKVITMIILSVIEHEHATGLGGMLSGLTDELSAANLAPDNIKVVINQIIKGDDPVNNAREITKLTPLLVGARYTERSAYHVIGSILDRQDAISAAAYVAKIIPEIFDGRIDSTVIDAILSKIVECSDLKEDPADLGKEYYKLAKLLDQEARVNWMNANCFFKMIAAIPQRIEISRLFRILIGDMINKKFKEEDIFPVLFVIAKSMDPKKVIDALTVKDSVSIYCQILAEFDGSKYLDEQQKRVAAFAYYYDLLKSNRMTRASDIQNAKAKIDIRQEIYRDHACIGGALNYYSKKDDAVNYGIENTLKCLGLKRDMCWMGDKVEDSRIHFRRSSDPNMLVDFIRLMMDMGIFDRSIYVRDGDYVTFNSNKLIPVQLFLRADGLFLEKKDSFEDVKSDVKVLTTSLLLTSGYKARFGKNSHTISLYGPITDASYTPDYEEWGEKYYGDYMKANLWNVCFIDEKAYKYPYDSTYSKTIRRYSILGNALRSEYKNGADKNGKISLIIRDFIGKARQLLTDAGMSGVLDVEWSKPDHKYVSAVFDRLYDAKDSDVDFEGKRSTLTEAMETLTVKAEKAIMLATLKDYVIWKKQQGYNKADLDLICEVIYGEMTNSGYSGKELNKIYVGFLMSYLGLSGGQAKLQYFKRRSDDSFKIGDAALRRISIEDETPEAGTDMDDLNKYIDPDKLAGGNEDDK